MGEMFILLCQARREQERVIDLYERFISVFCRSEEVTMADLLFRHSQAHRPDHGGDLHPSFPYLYLLDFGTCHGHDRGDRSLAPVGRLFSENNRHDDVAG